MHADFELCVVFFVFFFIEKIIYCIEKPISNITYSKWEMITLL